MKEITTKELQELLKKDKRVILLDCRSRHYYNWEHIPGARNLRWRYVLDKAETLFPDKKSTIITYCDGFTCNASVRCYERLSELGYKNLVEYSGGLADWKAHGLPTTINSEFKIMTNVYRLPDQEFYSETAGSYLIEEDDFVLLVDGPQQYDDEIEDFLRHSAKPIKIFMSHHPTAGAGKELQKRFSAKVYLHEADKSGEWLTVKPDKLIKDGFKFNDHLTIIHTPGHSPSSSVIYDSNNKIMFTGDHVQGNNKGEIYDFIKYDDGISGNPRERLASAKKLLKYDFEMILPFHYEMVRAGAKEKLSVFVENTISSPYEGEDLRRRR